jgi:hypothetical protein
MPVFALHDLDSLFQELVGERQPYGTGTCGPHNSAAFGILVPGGQGRYQHARIQDGERAAQWG